MYKLPNKDEIVTTLRYADSIAFDTCHKIYILMDSEQTEKMKGYGYDPLVSNREASPEQMLELIQKWWDDSCALRFIEAVKTKPDGEHEWITIVGQGEDEEEDQYA
jgi:hypothetical protein